MYRLVRWYNQNRRMFWVSLITILGVIGLIQSLNNYYKNNPKIIGGTSYSTTSYNTDNYTTNNYSIVTQKEINNNEALKLDNFIEKFFNYCNKGEIENAYNLLSEECKQELYPTIEEFILKYYNKVFTENKIYEATLWINNGRRYTYRVEIITDALAIGRKGESSIEEYFTIVYKNGEYKLNISNYIGKEEISKSKTQNNITVNILYKKMYIDYEIYEIKVENNTRNNLIFNTKERTNSIYLQNTNNLKYNAFLNEIPNSKLEILNGTYKTIEIKFNKEYNPTIAIEKIVFEDINNNNEIDILEVSI